MIFKALFIFSPSRITGDTAPSFDSLSYKLEFLKKGIEMKVDSDFQRSFAESLLNVRHSFCKGGELGNGHGERAQTNNEGNRLDGQEPRAAI